MGVAESPPKPGLLKALHDNGIKACNDGGWQAVSEASHTSRTTATSGGEDNEVYADKCRLAIEQLQKWLSEESPGSCKGFEEIKASLIGLFGQPEAQRVIDEVCQAERQKMKADEIAELLENEKQKAKGNASSGKRAKVKTSQRKGYG